MRVPSALRSGFESLKCGISFLSERKSRSWADLFDTAPRALRFPMETCADPRLDRDNVSRKIAQIRTFSGGCVAQVGLAAIDE
jgi:hypothetical protein